MLLPPPSRLVLTRGRPAVCVASCGTDVERGKDKRRKGWKEGRGGRGGGGGGGGGSPRLGCIWEIPTIDQVVMGGGCPQSKVWFLRSRGNVQYTRHNWVVYNSGRHEHDSQAF